MKNYWINMFLDPSSIPKNSLWSASVTDGSYKNQWDIPYAYVRSVDDSEKRLRLMYKMTSASAANMSNDAFEDALDNYVKKFESINEVVFEIEDSKGRYIDTFICLAENVTTSWKIKKPTSREMFIVITIEFDHMVIS